jgi:hypothetical protein
MELIRRFASRPSHEHFFWAKQRSSGIDSLCQSRPCSCSGPAVGYQAACAISRIGVTGPQSLVFASPRMALSDRHRPPIATV